MNNKPEEILCGPDNLRSFTARLKQAVPGFYPVIKELYEGGMLPGLRGARLIIHPASLPDEKTEAPQYTCQHCRHWTRDTRGDGTGIGQCLLNSRQELLKWPGQMSCNKIEVIE